MDRPAAERLSRIFPGQAAAGQWVGNLGGERIQKLHEDTKYLADSDFQLALETVASAAVKVQGTLKRPRITSVWKGSSAEGIEGKKRCGLAYSKRTETSDKVIQAAVSHGVVVMAAPPYTGKTSLLQCVQDRALDLTAPTPYKQDIHMVDISYTSCATCSKDIPFERAYEAWNGRKFIEPATSNSGRELEQGSTPVRLILIDETQRIYNHQVHRGIWDLVKDVNIQQRGQRRVAIVMAAAYSGNPVADNGPTPPHIAGAETLLPSLSCISEEVDHQITESKASGEDLDPGPVHLNYTRREYDQYLSAWFEQHKVDDSPEISELKNLIFHMTEGLPGTVELLLHLIRTKFVRHHASPATLAKLSKNFLLSKHMLSSCASSDCFLKSEWFLKEDTAFLELIRDIVQRLGQITYIQLGMLSKAAQAHASKMTSHGHLISFEAALHLPSTLHLEVMRFLPLGSSCQDAGALPDSLDEFLLLAVQKMDPAILALTKRISRASEKPLELVYAAELYRALMSLLPPACTVSPNYGGEEGVKGRLDLFVWPMGWAIEHLWEHSRIQEHVMRFRKGEQGADDGRYFKLVQSGKIRQWAVLDCYSHTASFQPKDKEGVTYISFRNESSADSIKVTATLQKGTKKTVVPCLGSQFAAPKFRCE